MPQVALVLVSHSSSAAQGTAEIARQMAPDVLVLPAGGTDEGIGTSVDRVLGALDQALAAAEAGVVVLTDLGSAVLTTEAVLEMLDDGADRVRVPSAPFVEGAVTAAVEAQQGGDLAAVTAAAVRAGSVFDAVGAGGGDGGAVDPDGAAGGAASAADGGAQGDDGLAATVVVANPLGLHARPAALLARTIAGSGARVTVDGVDGASVLALMALGATGGRELTIRASGPNARQALDTVVAMIAEGFGEA